MHPVVLTALITAVLMRIITGAISLIHERRLKQGGGYEIGRRNSLLLATLHITILAGCIVEAAWRHTQLTRTVCIGMGLWLFAVIVLVAVIRQLGPIWTFKLIILPRHPVVATRLFRWIRHPNYFLNLLPELAGVILIAQARFSAILLAPYLISLAVRIAQEERAMRSVRSTESGSRVPSSKRQTADSPRT